MSEAVKPAAKRRRKPQAKHLVEWTRSGIVWVARCRCGWGTWFWRESAAAQAVYEHLEAAP